MKFGVFEPVEETDPYLAPKARIASTNGKNSFSNISIDTPIVKYFKFQLKIPIQYIFTQIVIQTLVFTVRAGQIMALQLVEMSGQFHVQNFSTFHAEKEIFNYFTRCCFQFSTNFVHLISLILFRWFERNYFSFKYVPQDLIRVQV